MNKFNARQVETWFKGQIKSLKNQIKESTTKEQKKALERYLKIFLSIQKYVETDAKTIMTAEYKGFKELVKITSDEMESIYKLKSMTLVEKEQYKLTLEYMKYILELVETKKRGH